MRIRGIESLVFFCHSEIQQGSGVRCIPRTSSRVIFCTTCVACQQIRSSLLPARHCYTGLDLVAHVGKALSSGTYPNKGIQMNTAIVLSLGL